MTYKITIEKTETVEAMTERNWTKIAEKDGENQYGYAPQVPETKNVTRTVLILRMSELNVSDVVTTILDFGDPL